MSQTEHSSPKSKDGSEKYRCKKHTRRITLNIIDGESKPSFSDKVDLNDGKSPCDVLGMYTGVPQDENDKPIQDADDL